MARPLSILLPALALAGCDPWLPGRATHSCSDFQGGTFENERAYGVSTEELEAAFDDDGEISEQACHALCRANHWWEDQIVEIHSCSVEQDVPADTGALPHSVTCAWTENMVCEGRAHAALLTHAGGTGPSHLAAWLARAAHAEAASVKAFVSLARELRAHGAPAPLIAACRRAAADEVDHARRIGALAERHGGRPTKPRMGPTPVRPQLELAVENAVEGCVRETWSAMVAHWQARHADDPRVREVMSRVAVDEAQHGELAHAIHAWALQQLDDAGRAEVLAARDRAVAQLLDGLDREVEPELIAAAGLPDRARSLALASRLVRELWS